MLGAKFTWMSLLMKKDVPFNPGDVRLLSAQTEVPESSHIADLFEQSLFGHG